MPESRVEIRQHLSATPEKVFAAFADAGLVVRWLTPSPEITLTLLHFDFREGGAYRLLITLTMGRPSLSAALIT